MPGVPNRETRENLPVAGQDALDPQSNLASMRELGRVTKQIREHLSQPSRISDPFRWKGRGDVTGELDSALCHRQGNQIEAAFQQIRNVERRRVQFHMPGFDLGKSRTSLMIVSSASAEVRTTSRLVR